jgi:hypothetical protein
MDDVLDIEKAIGKINFPIAFFVMLFVIKPLLLNYAFKRSCKSCLIKEYKPTLYIPNPAKINNPIS